MFALGEPSTGPEHIAELARLEREGSAYLATFTTAAFFAPQGPPWAPAEHVRHLRKSAEAVTRALRLPRLVLAVAFGQHRDGSLSFAAMQERYRAALTGGAQAGRFAPAPRPVSSDPEALRGAIMARWVAAGSALRASLARWPEARLDLYRLPHPVLGPLSVREMMSFTVYHTAHHLRRIAERASDAPASLRLGAAE
jgi:hypothetical protein